MKQDRKIYEIRLECVCVLSVIFCTNQQGRRKSTSKQIEKNDTVR